MTEIFMQFGKEIVLAIFVLIFSLLGYSAKHIAIRCLDTAEKKQLAKEVVLFVEQKFKDLHGEDKFIEATNRLVSLLNERGISTNMKEVEILIESAVGAFNDVFHK